MRAKSTHYTNNDKQHNTQQIMGYGVEGVWEWVREWAGEVSG